MNLLGCQSMEVLSAVFSGADVNRETSTNDHTVLSLACAGGHLAVVELLLRNGANSIHKLKDGSTMLIEAAKGGHTSVVNLLLDWPNNNVLSSSPDLHQLSPPQSTVDVSEVCYLARALQLLS